LWSRREKEITALEPIRERTEFKRERKWWGGGVDSTWTGLDRRD